MRVTPRAFQRLYARSNYRLVGRARHSAIKPCHWLRMKLFTGRSNRNCYKGSFGVKSERCMQCTPALPYCTHNCAFCWREVEKGNLGQQFSVEPDPPEELIPAMIENQRNLVDHHLPLARFLGNYSLMERLLDHCLKNGGTFDVNGLAKRLGASRGMLEEAILVLKMTGVLYTRDHHRFFLVEGLDPSMGAVELLRLKVTTKEEIIQAHRDAHQPSHAAISLAGEPLLYPHVDGLVSGFRRRGFTTFIVTNGTLPGVIEKMDSLPTQLYVTLPPPSRDAYIRLHRPAIKDGFQRIMETLDLLPSLDCRTVARITLVKGLNDDDIDGYVAMIRRANPDFVDVKGFAVEARALNIKVRLGLGGDGSTITEGACFAPSFDEVMSFARALSARGGFPVIAESRTSRDVLLRVNWPENRPITIDKP